MSRDAAFWCSRALGTSEIQIGSLWFERFVKAVVWFSAVPLVPTRFKVAFAIQSISRQRHNPYREWKLSFPTFPSRKWYPKLAKPRQSVEGPRGREVTPLVSDSSWEVPIPGNLSSCTFCGVNAAAPPELLPAITLLTLHKEVPSIAPEVV